MEREKQSYQYGHGDRQNVGSHDVISDLVVEAARVVDRTLQDRVRCTDYRPGRGHAVENHAQEVFVVVKADAVCHPGAVVVHLQDASIALRAVVAAVGLCFVAPLANANATILFLLH